MSKPYISTLISISSVALFLVLWFIASKFSLVDPLFFPSPESLFSSFIDIYKNGYKGNPLASHIFDSLLRLMTAFILAWITAIPLGLISGFSKPVRAIFEPFIEFYRPLPPLAYYTLLVLWLGIGDVSKIALLYLGAFAPLYIAAVAGAQQVPVNRIQAAQSLGANKLKIFTHIIFPSALPEVLTGTRTALGFTYTTLVAAEMVAATSGVGWMVLDASKFLRSDIIVIGILIMAVMAILIDVILRTFEKRLIPWKGKE